MCHRKVNFKLTIQHHEAEVKVRTETKQLSCIPHGVLIKRKALLFNQLQIQYSAKVN